ncbi:MAG: carbohydrate kinase [Cyanobacteria bacterium P01_H01_bin.130]
MPVPQVVCVGEILWDCLADPMAGPSAGVPLDKIEKWIAHPGGAPANVAFALAKLGVPSALVTCVGQDAAGDQLVKLLQRGGVNTDGVQRHPTAPTREVYVTQDPAGDRQFAAFGVAGKGQQDTTTFADTRLVAQALPEALFASAKLLVLGTLGLAYPDTGAAIARALDLADQHYLPVFLDLNWRPLFWSDPSQAKATIAPILERVDLLKVSADEAQWMFETTDPGAIAQKLDHLEGVIVTDGAKGCAYCLGGHMGEVEGFSVAAVDTTGAGDGFVAGFIGQLLQGGGVQQLSDPKAAYRMVTYGNAVGALVTQKSGAIAAQPHQTQVENLLRQKGLIR